MIPTVLARAGWLASFGGVFVWSAIDPHDYLTWVLEVSPAVIALILVAVITVFADLADHFREYADYCNLHAVSPTPNRR